MKNELNKIERAIEEVDPTTFQKLCDEYLKKEIGGHLNPLGSEDGKNKPTKGTPDSYILKDNGDIYLMEYTSQKNMLFSKINDDLKKIDKLKIDRSNIKKIIYCSATSNISLEEIEVFKEKYKKEEIKFEFISNLDIAMDIQNKYRDLANKYLGFELMPLQLKSIIDFSREYNTQFNGSLLGTYFGYRETELEEIKKSFENSNAVLLTGRAGVGKTRLAFEFARNFTGDKFFVHNVYDLHELILEMQTAFEDATPKLVVFDDANQIDNFKKIFQAFLRQMNSGKIKILITVRDYAKDEVEKELKDYLSIEVINLHDLSGEQIRECVKYTYKINDEIILDRICKISYGNLRMAMLAATAYLKNKKISDIADISVVYDKLLGNLLENVINNDKNKLICLGIMAFLKNFNIENDADKKLYKAILDKNGVSFEEFKQNIIYFDKQEVIDYIDYKFVNFPDQVMENYVLKVIFLDKKLLSLSLLIELVFEIKSKLVRTHIINLENTFYNAENRKYLTQEVREAWQYFQKNNEKNEQYLKFVFFFARFNVNKAISLIIKKINSVAPYLGKVNFTIVNGASFNDWILKIIDEISYADEYKYAVQLFCEYLIKQPQKFNQFYLAVIQDWNLTYDNFRYLGFERQKYLINNLMKKYLDNESVLQLLLLIIPKYLGLVIENVSEAINDSSHFMIRHFQVIDTKENLDFRKYMWNCLIEISSKSPNTVKDVINSYGRDISQFLSNKVSLNTKNVIKFDLNYISLLISKLFSYKNMSDCIEINRLNDRLSSLNLQIPSINEFINNGDYKLVQDLQSFSRLNRNSDKLRSYVSSNMKSPFLDLKRIVRIILDLEKHGINATINLYGTLEIILDKLKCNKDKYIKGVKILISSGIKNENIFYEIFGFLSKNYAIREIIALLENTPKDKKDLYYYIYFGSLPQNEVNKENYDLLKQYLSQETMKEIGIYKYRDMRIMYKFKDYNSNAFEDLCQIIYLKGDEYRKVYFRNLNLNDIQAKQLVNSFHDIKLLENIYVDCLLNDDSDYSGYLLLRMYEKDAFALDKYIDKVLIEKIKNYRIDSEHELIVLLESKSSNEVLNTIWNRIWQTKNRLWVLNWCERLANLINEGSDRNNSIDTWIKLFIKENHSSYLKMKLLLDGLAYKGIDTLCKYIKEYISFKPDFEDFKKMPIYLRSVSYSINESSIRKIYGQEIDSLQKLSDWVGNQGDLDYFLYKRRIDECIEWKKKELEYNLGKLKADMI